MPQQQQLTPHRVLQAGESFWKVTLQSGRTLSELDVVSIPVIDAKDPEKKWFVRRYEWLEDLIGSSDIRNVKEVMLCTPKGVFGLKITEPYTVFQLSRGTASLLEGERHKNAQIIGRVDDKDTGASTAYVWDVQEQEAYQVTFSIHDGFPAWREGVIPVGALNLKAMDVRL